MASHGCVGFEFFMKTSYCEAKCLIKGGNIMMNVYIFQCKGFRKNKMKIITSEHFIISCLVPLISHSFKSRDLAFSSPKREAFQNKTGYFMATCQRVGR